MYIPSKFVLLFLLICAGYFVSNYGSDEEMITVAICSLHSFHVFYNCCSSFINEDMINLIYCSSCWIIPGVFVYIFVLLIVSSLASANHNRACLSYYGNFLWLCHKNRHVVSVRSCCCFRAAPSYSNSREVVLKSAQKWVET